MATVREFEKWRCALSGRHRRRTVKALIKRRDDPDVIPLLARVAGGRPSGIAGRVIEVLESLHLPPVVEALCEEAIKDPDGAVAKICIRRGLRPSTHDRCCLFLFVTRQFDGYFNEDFEFQGLSRAYDHAADAVRAHVMEVVRSGDRRCQGFFGGRKGWQECTDQEIALAIESAVRHRDWSRLFQAFLELPVRLGLPALERLRESGWEPEDARASNLYQQALADTAGKPAPPAGVNSGFDRWLKEGLTGELVSVGEEELLERLQKATPLEGVAIVSALANRVEPRSAAAKVVRASPHWLIRFAGCVTGLCAATSDKNYWVKEWPLMRFLEIWPGRGTHADLKEIEALPEKQWTDSHGPACKVLRALIRYHLSNIPHGFLHISGPTRTAKTSLLKAEALLTKFEPVE